jgi:hypothetical protein
MSQTTSVPLKMSRNKEGMTIPGLWESDIVRMEAVKDGWKCQVPMQEIGETNVYEFRPLELGGEWRNIGTYRTREVGCYTALLLQAGTHVLDGGYTDELGKMPAMVVEWIAVKDKIAAHPSTH